MLVGVEVGVEGRRPGLGEPVDDGHRRRARRAAVPRERPKTRAQVFEGFAVVQRGVAADGAGRECEEVVGVRRGGEQDEGGVCFAVEGLELDMGVELS